MAPNRFVKERKAREVTPYRDEPPPASLVPLRPTTPRPDRQPSPLPDPRPVTPAPPEWSSYDAPINFTWVIPDELCGMGWPKSRDQVNGRGEREDPELLQIFFFRTTCSLHNFSSLPVNYLCQNKYSQK
jgi:hypothetical protein